MENILFTYEPQNQTLYADRQRTYNLNRIAAIILDSDFTKSGFQLGSNGVVEKPLGDVMPSRPAK